MGTYDSTFLRFLRWRGILCEFSSDVKNKGFLRFLQLRRILLFLDLFRVWKEDVLVDIDAFDKYKQLLVSIWPQSQITKTTYFYNLISCQAFITKTSPMFVL